MKTVSKNIQTRKTPFFPTNYNFAPVPVKFITLVLRTLGKKDMYNRRESQNDAEKERNTAKRIKKKTNSLIELTLDILNAPFASAVNELSS